MPTNRAGAHAAEIVTERTLQLEAQAIREARAAGLI